MAYKFFDVWREYLLQLIIRLWAIYQLILLADILHADAVIRQPIKNLRAQYIFIIINTIIIYKRSIMLLIIITRARRITFVIIFITFVIGFIAIVIVFITFVITFITFVIKIITFVISIIATCCIPPVRHS